MVVFFLRFNFTLNFNGLKLATPLHSISESADTSKDVEDAVQTMAPGGAVIGGVYHSCCLHCYLRAWYETMMELVTQQSASSDVYNSL
ncbi:uncharacterized protein ARB_06759 [Trichophyton benhamiae CBS 112371]|uniref:Uncharacterized protein n=1 Tax=Arthroderma benhamiae (strain ATCC MYA-4681 / CBS 112371) TaxID=663331 RepID=D4ARL6_ARTBC|nr:uncharacterized protein ARB_06759 [Trichophyton benhamiae CBS 112371]EFE34359.1 hypothetical protein ARB_06759 [Trichophyton benhamiae CBS 112371]